MVQGHRKGGLGRRRASVQIKGYSSRYQKWTALRDALPWGIQIGPLTVHKTYFWKIYFHFINKHMQHFHFRHAPHTRPRPPVVHVDVVLYEIGLNFVQNSILNGSWKVTQKSAPKVAWESVQKSFPLFQMYDNSSVPCWWPNGVLCLSPEVHSIVRVRFIYCLFWQMIKEK